MSTIFFFNILAVFIFPVLGHVWHMSNFQFGLWSGTAINDTSSVVAAAFSYSKAAGEMATIVKLDTRPDDCTSLFGLDRFKMVSEQKQQGRNKRNVKENYSLGSSFGLLWLLFFHLSIWYLKWFFPYLRTFLTSLWPWPWSESEARFLGNSSVQQEQPPF